MRVLVIGAGRCGTAIAAMLAASGDYAITLADSDENAEARAGGLPFRR